jgi:hypothetical protein
LASFDFLPFFIQTDETCDLNFISNMIQISTSDIHSALPLNTTS